MKKADELRGEIEALRNRLAKLSVASLRISESLDVNTVLHEVVESARALTGARYGAITTVDDGGRSRTSSPPDSHRRSTGRWRSGPTGGGSSNNYGTCRAR